MPFSRQFKALVRISTFFGVAWGSIGTLVSMLTGAPFVPSLLTFGAMFGIVGGVSGISTALLIARGESGRELAEVSTWRVTFWGFLGGFTPGALFALIAMAVGNTDVLGLLLAVSLFSGGIASALSGAAAAAAKRVGPGDREDQPKLPAL